MLYTQSHESNKKEKIPNKKGETKNKKRSHLVGLSLLFSYHRILLASSELRERIEQSEHHWNEGDNFVPSFLLLCHITCS